MFRYTAKRNALLFYKKLDQIQLNLYGFGIKIIDSMYLDRKARYGFTVVETIYYIMERRTFVTFNL